MFRGSVKGTGYSLHSPVSSSIPLPCVTVCHHVSTGVYYHSFIHTSKFEEYYLKCRLILFIKHMNACGVLVWLVGRSSTVLSNIFLYYVQSLTNEPRTWTERDLEFCKRQENERVIGMSLVIQSHVWYQIILNGFQLNLMSVTVVFLGPHWHQHSPL